MGLASATPACDSYNYGPNMADFKQKAYEPGARFNKGVADFAERLEKESADLINYLNSEVVPAVRTHSSKALRVAATELTRLADFFDEQKRS